MPDMTEIAEPEALVGDLRRVGSHPDHWYPVAWSRELKPGHTYATQFAGFPIVLVRPKGQPVFALEDRWRIAGAAVQKGGGRLPDPLQLSWLDL